MPDLVRGRGFSNRGDPGDSGLEGVPTFVKTQNSICSVGMFIIISQWNLLGDCVVKPVVGPMANALMTRLGRVLDNKCRGLNVSRWVSYCRGCVQGLYVITKRCMHSEDVVYASACTMVASYAAVQLSHSYSSSSPARRKPLFFAVLGGKRGYFVSCRVGRHSGCLGSSLLRQV